MELDKVPSTLNLAFDLDDVIIDFNEQFIPFFIGFIQNYLYYKNYINTSILDVDNLVFNENKSEIISVVRDGKELLTHKEIADIILSLDFNNRLCRVKFNFLNDALVTLTRIVKKYNNILIITARNSNQETLVLYIRGMTYRAGYGSYTNRDPDSSMKSLEVECAKYLYDNVFNGRSDMYRKVKTISTHGSKNKKVFLTDQKNKMGNITNIEYKYLVDDKLETVLECSEVLEHVFLYSRPWNRNINDSELPKNVTRVSNLMETYYLWAKMENERIEIEDSKNEPIAINS